MSGGLRYANVELLPEKWRMQAKRQLGHVEKHDAPKRSKYGAKRVTADGILFDSKREARRYALLKAMQDAGEIKRFHRQVMFDLPGGIIYRCDFMVIQNDDSIVYEDSKGFRREKIFRMKMRLLKSKYGVDISLV